MPSMNARTQTLGEEIADSVSHGAALLAAIAALPFLVVAARHAGVDSVVAGTGCHFFAVLGYAA
jgi:hemolysin III